MKGHWSRDWETGTIFKIDRTPMKRILLLGFVTALNQLVMAQDKKIIFVCEHGAAKSVIATAYFNKMAKERNLGYFAECRGTDPDSTVSKGAKDGLVGDDLFDPSTKPQKLSSSDTVNAERIILFTPLPPDHNTNIKTENWSNVQNIDADYEKRRNAIVNKITELLDSLEKQ
jgi:arsenate reductase (thioredoxin)